MSDTLKPCPFCGAQPEHDFFPISHYPHELYCDKCIGVVATQKKTFDEAAAAWNRRAPVIPPDVRETMRALIRFADTMQWTHSIGVSQAATLIETWLEAQLAQLAQTWQPLPDGQYAVQFNGAYIELDRDCLKVFEPLLGRDYGDESEVGLPTNIRLCRLVESEPLT